MHPGEFYALPQSPQLYKQLLMVAGFDRYFQIARCFRDEDLRADRQPEFTQIDVEASFITLEDVLGFGEGLMCAVGEGGGSVRRSVAPRCATGMPWSVSAPTSPTSATASSCSTRPTVFRDTEFGVTRAAIVAGGRVRGIRIPGGASLSRKQLDEIESYRQGAGRRRPAPPQAGRRCAGGPGREVPEPRCRVRLGLAEGDLCLLVAGPDHVSSPALDRVRQEVARRLDLIPSDVRRFVWVIDFPLFERDPATGALSSVNHPFTAPHPEDLPLLQTAPERVRALAYDVVLNGTELGGGSLRIAIPRLQRQVFGLLGLADDLARSNASGSCSRGCGRARRRTADSLSAWTGSRWSWAAPTRCGM